MVSPTLDAAVLQALAATTSQASGAQVHRMAGVGSADGVRRALARLVGQGIVLAEEHPSATFYRFNREHVAADAILPLTRLRTTIIERITDAVSTWPLEPVHASLFGSFARAEATTASDIDILVVFDTGTTDHHGARATQVDELAADILRWTGNHAHIVDSTPDVLARMVSDDDPLVASWRVDHLNLTGIRLLDLLRRLS